MSEAQISLDTQLAQAEDIEPQEIAGELVLLDPTDRAFGLDPIGADIWRAFEVPTTPTAVIESLMERYDVERSRCASDVLDLVRRLCAAELLVPAEGAST